MTIEHPTRKGHPVCEKGLFTNGRAHVASHLLLDVNSAIPTILQAYKQLSLITVSRIDNWLWHPIVSICGFKHNRPLKYIDAATVAFETAMSEISFPQHHSQGTICWLQK